MEDGILEHKPDWPRTQERFKAWWNRSRIDRPMLCIQGRRNVPLGPELAVGKAETPEQSFLDVELKVEQYREHLRTHWLMAEAFPNLSANLGPGSVALYLGSEPRFAWDTLWYEECVTDWKSFGDLKYQAANPWWLRHQQMIRRAVELARGEFLVSIPDLVENVDILAALRGPQAMCYDLIDQPELIRQYVSQLDDIYFTYYDAMYDIVKTPDGGSSYTSFLIWGPGKTAKLQCDFAAMMSPTQFREFVVPSLRKQCRALDFSLFHLDGPDAVRHLDALMEIDELDALQWTPGAGKPDCGGECWYPIYDKVRAADKSLWLYLADGDLKDAVSGADKIVERYGPDGLYFPFFHEMTEDQGDEVIQHAKTHWG